MEVIHTLNLAVLEFCAALGNQGYSLERTSSLTPDEWEPVELWHLNPDGMEYTLPSFTLAVQFNGSGMAVAGIKRTEPPNNPLLRHSITLVSGNGLSQYFLPAVPEFPEGVSIPYLLVRAVSLDAARNQLFDVESLTAYGSAGNLGAEVLFSETNLPGYLDASLVAFDPFSDGTDEDGNSVVGEVMLDLDLHCSRRGSICFSLPFRSFQPVYRSRMRYDLVEGQTGFVATKRDLDGREIAVVKGRRVVNSGELSRLEVITGSAEAWLGLSAFPSKDAPLFRYESLAARVAVPR
ncbi:hypothetical protein HYU18_01600 [Candidatus Woesearchaeota archaeon]|nr:hypothetical protein [Candidatus Woesearchaeota archaeon]